MVDVVVADKYLLTHILQHDPSRERCLVWLKAHDNNLSVLKKRVLNMEQYDSICRTMNRMYRCNDCYDFVMDRLTWRITLMKEVKAVCRLWRDVCRTALTDPIWFSSYGFYREYNCFYDNIAIPLTLPLAFTIHPDGEEYDRNGFFVGRYAGYGCSQESDEVAAGNPFNSVRGVLHHLNVLSDDENETFLISNLEFTIDGKDGTYSSFKYALASMPGWSQITLDDKDDMYFLKRIKVGMEMRHGYWHDIIAHPIEEQLWNDLYDKTFQNHPNYPQWSFRNRDGSLCAAIAS
jgi:hypothetical protein